MPYTFQRLRHARPALGPVRALLARIPLGPRPSLHWLRRGWLPAVQSAGGLFRFVRRLHGYYGVVRLLVSVHHRLRLLVFPMRTRSAHGLWSDTRYPSFRRDPFARDVALDPGGMTMPRIPASLMLRSTMMTVSAPAISSFRGSLPHPTQQLCTLRVRRHRRLTQHSLPGGLLGPTWAGLAPADRASFCWRLPSLDNLVGAAEQRDRHRDAERLGGLHVDGQLDFRHLLHRQVGQLRTFEDAADVNPNLAVGSGQIRGVAHKPSN